MNNKRRAAIRKVIDKIGELINELEELKNEEEEYFDNMPEPLQDSERGDAALEHIDQLQDAIDELCGAKADAQCCAECADCVQEETHLHAAVSQLEEAIEDAKSSVE